MAFCHHFVVVGLLLAAHIILSTVLVEAQSTNSSFSSNSSIPPSPASIPPSPASIPPSDSLDTDPAPNASQVGISPGVLGWTFAAVLVVCFIVGCVSRWIVIPRQCMYDIPKFSGSSDLSGEEVFPGTRSLDLDIKICETIDLPCVPVPCTFTFGELSKATKNFSRSELLGSGRLGMVYKGILPSGALVAVKRMRMEITHRESFEAELVSLSQIRHRHLVNLQGWCHDEDQLLLVYDYKCNGSLDECPFLFSEQNGQGSHIVNGYDAPSLMFRHSVLSDVAASLSYLHEEQCMLHRNIKSSNVLLDGSESAYLGDFGLTLFVDHEMKARTFGSMAPEILLSCKATKESDVYSFGVLMLEVMCGMRAPNDTSGIGWGESMLVDKVWLAHAAGNILQVADSFLLPSDVETSGSHVGEIELQGMSLICKRGNDTDDVDQSLIYVPDAETVDKKLIANLLHLGLLCCSRNPKCRPPMRQVSQWLLSTEYMEICLPPLPAYKPQTRFYGPAQALQRELEFCLRVAEQFMKEVQKMSESRKFNHEQCGYLVEKLQVAVQSAIWFLKVSREKWLDPFSSAPSSRLAQNFKFLVALAKQTQSFVQGCCKYEWIQAAMTLSNVPEYVSSLGFNLEMCRIAFCTDFEATGCLTLVEVGDINKAEVEIVERKATADVGTLLQKVRLELISLEGENRDLACYLLQRLLRVRPNPTYDDKSFLGQLFNWVTPGEQLGHGASAVVYKAMWLGKPVAKKTFAGSENTDFVKEVQILSQLSHPNITSMFCYGNTRQKCSIIMELMDEDLHKLMERRCGKSNDSHPFLILEAVDIMLQIGEGVNYLHMQKIVHRDLKSMNVLVKHVKPEDLDTGYVLAKVTDFGISKKKDKTTTYSNQTSNTGTNRWMPPEIMTLTTDNQESGLSRSDKLPNYPFKCDSYSFGMVCYEILTGCVPFSNIHSPNDIKRMVMKDQKRPDLPTDCPPKLKALIERCWSQEPKDRPTFATICLELKYLKYLLMTGNYAELESTGSSHDQ